MKRKASSLIVCFILVVVSSVCCFAGTDSLLGNDVSVSEPECVKNICERYDIDSCMTKEALETFKNVASVSTICEYDESQNISVVTYVIDPYEAQETRVLSNGSQIEERVAIAYSYVYENTDLTPVRAVTGSISETHVLSDVTFVTTIGYTTKTSGGIEWMRMNVGKAKITRFLESNLRNLKITCKQWGVVESGNPDQTVSKTVASPVINQLYSKSTGWTNFVGKNQGILKVTSQVTYSHGASNYTVSSFTTFGSGV